MGMAASQGRLLFMTARLSNNEFEQQCVAQSKQRLADQSTRANDTYLEALNATQYKVLSGYNGETPNYEAVTYNQLTGINTVAAGKQYIVSDSSNRIVVSTTIADAFNEANGDYNKFLQRLGGYTQVEKTNITSDDVHNAWDKYLVSVGLSNPDLGEDNDIREHILGFGFVRENTNQLVNVNEKVEKIAIEYPTYKTGYITSLTGNKIYLNKDEKIASAANSEGYYVRNYELQPYMHQHEDGTTELFAYYKPEGQDFTDEMNIIEGLRVVYDEASGKYSYYMKESVFNEKFVTSKDKDDEEKFTRVELTVGGTVENTDGVENVDKNEEVSGDETVEGTTDDGNIEGEIPEEGNSTNTPKTETYVCLGDTVYINPYDVNTLSDSAITEVAATTADPKWQNGILYSNITNKSIALNYDGATKEQREMYDYAMAVTKYYATANEDKLKYDADAVSHYQHIYNQMLTKGFTTYKDMIKDGYMAVTETSENTAFQDEQWLITQLKNGKLNISYYSTVDKEFVATTLDDDESITEKEDTKKIAIAEQIYNSTMDRIESEDKRFDMQLNRLESEHSALQTEYESVSKVISKNVEKSFNIFNA